MSRGIFEDFWCSGGMGEEWQKLDKKARGNVRFLENGRGGRKKLLGRRKIGA